MNKKFIITILTLVTALLLLLLWGGDEYLQGIYLWIAKLENTARGIDGITEASRLKIMNDAVHHFAILKKVCYALLFITLLFFCLDRKRRLDRMQH